MVKRIFLFVLGIIIIQFSASLGYLTLALLDENVEI